MKSVAKIKNLILFLVAILVMGSISSCSNDGNADNPKIKQVYYVNKAETGIVSQD